MFQSHRHRQPRRGRDAAHPRRARPQRRTGRRAPHRDGRAATPTPSAPRCSSARPTTPTTSGPASRAPLPRPRRARARAASRPAPTPRGSAGASSPRTRRSPSCASSIGVTFIGPSAEAMRKLGDKIGAKLIAEEVGVPVAPWSRGAVDTLEDAHARAASAIGYPLMLKATAGGGGRGIRMVTSDAELADAYERTRDEAAARVRQRRGLPRAAGHRRPARRGAGHRRRPGHRVGARRARLLGAAPQPEGHRGVGLAGARRRAGRRAQGVGRAARRSPWATAAPAPSSSSTTRGEQLFAFLEVNTRLQVEHPITEVTTGIDLVKAADPRRRRRPARGRPARPRPGTPSRPGSTPRTPTATSRPSPGRIALLDAARRPRHPGRHRRRRGRHRSPPTSTR